MLRLNRLLDLFVSLYDFLEKREEGRNIGFVDKILGDVMYGTEHLVETIPHILLYGHPREFFDEFGDNEWLGRCMEGRQCLKMIQWHENFPKGVSPLEYHLEEEMIKSMRYFVGNCSVYDKMIEKSRRQFDLLRWRTPREYDLPFSLDPSDISKQQLLGRFEGLFRACETCPFRFL